MVRFYIFSADEWKCALKLHYNEKMKNNKTRWLVRSVGVSIENCKTFIIT